MNKKPSAPYLLGESPGRIQQQQLYSTNANGLIPEKMQFAVPPSRRQQSLPHEKGLRYSAFYCTHLKYYSAFLTPDYFTFSFFLKTVKSEVFFQFVIKYSETILTKLSYSILCRIWKEY
jgi:hypothetical protein